MKLNKQGVRDRMVVKAVVEEPATSDVPVEIMEALLAGWRSAPPRPENALVVLCECGYESAMVHAVNPKRRTRVLCDDDASTLSMNPTTKAVTCLTCLAR